MIDRRFNKEEFVSIEGVDIEANIKAEAKRARYG